MELQAPATVQQEEDFSSAHAVFQISHIFKKILEFAIYDGNKARMSTVKACRRVSKHWLETVSDSLERNTDGPLCVLSDEKISNFCRDFQTSPMPIMPYAMEICIPRDCVFLSSLYLIGAGLARLDLEFYCRESHVFNLPNLVQWISEPLQLPRLKIINIDVSLCCLLKYNCPEVHGSVQTLLRAILRGSEFLEKVCFTNESDIAGPGLQLELPNSVTQVEFHGEFRGSDFTSILLGINSLPTLSSLRLAFTRDFINEFSDILQHYRQQLKQLETFTYTLPGSPPSITSFPVMKCLEKFICVGDFLFPDADCPNVERCFPKLKKLTLQHHTVGSVCKWLQTIRYPKVEEVQITDVYQESDATVREMCHQITTAFPVVTALELEIDYTRRLSYFQVLFRRMRQLVSLQVVVKKCPKDLTHHAFNAVLIGISPEEAAILEEQDDSSNKRILNYEELNSIVHMTELKKLKISTGYYHYQIKLISELAFEYAFLKMTKLRKIVLSGDGFSEPSPELTKRLMEHSITFQYNHDN